MLRASSLASVAALIMPRSATTPMRAIRKRVLSRSMTGKRGGHVGGVAGPQLGTDRPPAAVDDDGEHDLFQIRAVVLRVAVLAEALAAGTLEIKRSGVEKHKAQFAEQVVAQGKQPLLDEVLGGAWAEAAPAPGRPVRRRAS